MTVEASDREQAPAPQHPECRDIAMAFGDATNAPARRAYVEELSCVPRGTIAASRICSNGPATVRMLSFTIIFQDIDFH